MADLAVFVSNPGHHLATLAPVLEYVAERGVSARAHSLCELRGYRTPEGAFGRAGADVRTVWPRWLSRRPPGRAGADLPVDGRRREIARHLAWTLILAPRLARGVAPGSRLAVLPNDSAFPYDRLAAWLRRRGLPFVLVQEGIRFPLPAEREARYGLGGARAIAVWGEASADHFRALGVEPARIHVTGCPRFDGRPAVRWPARDVPRRPVSLLLLTNPIDAQGFCPPQEKTALVARFVTRLGEGLRAEAVTLAIRPHPGESADAYRRALRPEHRPHVRWTGVGDLDQALESADLAVVMASSVGLEALQRGVPLAVLPTPGHGFVHDYVEGGAALGIELGSDLTARLIAHATPTAAYSRAVNAYLERHLARPGRATEALGGLMIDLLDDE